MSYKEDQIVLSTHAEGLSKAQIVRKILDVYYQVKQIGAKSFKFKLVVVAYVKGTPEKEEHYTL